MKDENKLKNISETIQPAAIVKPEKFKNIEKMETEHAIYKFVYSNHEVSNEAGEVAGTNAVILEKVADYRNEKKAGVVFDSMKKSEQYSEIIRDSIEKNRPIFITDMSRADIALDRDSATSFINGALAGGAASCLAWGIKDLAKPKMSRRDFLCGTGKLAAGAYLAISPAAFFSFEFSTEKPEEGSASRKIQRFLDKIADRITFRFGDMKARNALTAQKAEDIARMLKKELNLKEKPTIAIVIGAAHIGLEDELAKNESDRLSYLQNHFTSDFEREGSIARFDFPFDQSSGEKTVKVSVLKDKNFQK